MRGEALKWKVSESDGNRRRRKTNVITNRG
jgi:hypothetical protein